ncbi:uncharacterized protein E0L32_009802 [Thyridium curvatum]|uniref:Uncharacterized protein n=1 Tax=Thyridium curvatum TaxID=1093900 RepID=A0A507AWU7_9PEZI|nr:uncharacterized protein E0L32_009802 [Thyridium curvatum]TPX08740.1 hypothetical protein E0L32_009802 [Thyridium curvatum]
MSRRDSLRANTGHVAYCEDADETGEAIEGTETYAASVVHSPTKERPNTRKTRKGGSASPPHGYDDSDSTAHPRRSRRESMTRPRDKEKERAATSNSKKTVTARPPNRHSKTTPVPVIDSSRRARDDPYYFGVETGAITTPASSRPRAYTSSQRPASYYGPTSRPPLTYNKYFQPPPPSAVPPTSFPPPSWAAAGPVSYPMPPPPPPMTGHPPEYFVPRSHNSLSSRFQLNRPQSAMSHRPPASIGYPDDYEQENERGGLVRRGSTRKAREEEDRARMPPPPRPMSARPLSIRPSPFAPPSYGSRPRHIAHFDDEEFDGEPDLYQDVPPLAASVYGSRQRPSLGNPAVSYEVGSYSTEVAASGGSRRNSYYNRRSLSSGSGLEEKLREAAAYQDDVSGGPSLPLTAESLRQAGKASAHSRSTRSSGSHEESDWRQSATTRTTRSSNDEDVTIRVKGSAVLKVGGAEMQCQDGAEINISSRDRPSVRGGSSDKSSYIDIDDRRTRFERPAIKAPRSSSQAGSYGRTAPMPMYDPYGYHYEYAPRHAPPENWL